MGTDAELFGRIFAVAKEYARIEPKETQSDELIKVILKGAIKQAELYTGFSLSKSEVRFKARDRDNLFVMPSTPMSEVKVYNQRGVLLERHPAGSESIQVGRTCMEDCLSSFDSYLEFRYEQGVCDYDDVPGDIIMGILRYFVYTYENRGDSNSLNLTTINDALRRSGAMAEWSSRLRYVG